MVNDLKEYTSPELLNKTINSIDDAVLILDNRKPSLIINCNQAANDIFGYNPGELDDMSFETLHVNPEMMEFFYLLSASGMRNNTGIHNLKFKMKRKNGSIFESVQSVYPQLDEEGLRTGWIYIIHDLSQKDKTAGLNKKNEKYYMAVFENSESGIIITDFSGNIFKSNTAFCQMTGYAEDSLFRLNISNISYPDDFLKERELLNAVKNGENNSYKTEKRIFTRDGEILYVNVYVSFVDEGISVDEGFFVHFFENSTAKKNYLAEKEKLIEQLKTAGKHKEEFLAVISHIMRTPLAGIIGFSELLYYDNHLTRNQKENARYLMEAALRMNDTLINLLELSRLAQEKDNVTPHITAIDLPVLINDISIRFMEQIKEKGCEFSYNILCDEKINSDKFCVEQILTNLIGNAVKYTQRGEITLEVGEKDGFYVFNVTDTGIGIDSSKFDEIFDAYKQLDNQSHSPVKRGIGLGLTVCKKFVALLGGEISVESKAGQGSRFTFTLPVINK